MRELWIPLSVIDLIIFLGFQSADNERIWAEHSRPGIAGDAQRQLGHITSGVKSRISDVAFLSRRNALLRTHIFAPLDTARETFFWIRK